MQLGKVDLQELKKMGATEEDVIWHYTRMLETIVRVRRRRPRMACCAVITVAGSW